MQPWVNRESEVQYMHAGCWVLISFGLRREEMHLISRYGISSWSGDFLCSHRVVFLVLE